MQPRCLSASVAMADSDYAINHVIHSLCLDVYGMDPPHNCNEQLGIYLQYISRHEQMRHDCPMFGGQDR